MTCQEASRAAEKAARASYGRLLAILAARSHDIATCEDVLAEAFASALRVWPDKGIPSSPEGWLLIAARNGLSNAKRHRRVHDAAAAEIERQSAMRVEAAPFPDERLKLLFVCAHPAIDPSIRTPLMLQTVLGLDAARIASAFLVAPTTMSQRLVRAKTKIRDAGIRFAIPDLETMPERLDDVLASIYAAYNAGWDAIVDPDAAMHGLAAEAIYLARLLLTLLPQEPEVRGLLALMLYCEARRDARRDAQGRFIPLAQQDARLWSRPMISEAESLLTQAATSAKFGRYQCEAAIQSVHCQRPLIGYTNQAALRTLYQLLAAHIPSTGVLVAQAAALMEAGALDEAVALLDSLDPKSLTRYQPYWAVRAKAFQLQGEITQAQNAFLTAAGLTEDASVRNFLLEAAKSLNS